MRPAAEGLPPCNHTAMSPIATCKHCTCSTGCNHEVAYRGWGNGTHSGSTMLKLGKKEGWVMMGLLLSHQTPMILP